MTASVSFRPAVPDEAAALADLINSAYRGESSRAGWTTEADFLEGRRTDAAEVRELIDAADSVILVCERDGVIIGSVHLHNNGDSAHLGMLVVRPDLQGGGIGKQFMQTAENFAQKTWAVTRITMTVITLRDELIAFYERRGYRRTGRITPFPDVALSVPTVDKLEFEEFVKDLTP